MSNMGCSGGTSKANCPSMKLSFVQPIKNAPRAMSVLTGYTCALAQMVRLVEVLQVDFNRAHLNRLEWLESEFVQYHFH